MTEPTLGAQWVSVAAVSWALDDAPCPTDLLATLIAIARRADEHGRGSRQTVATIAAKTGKSVGQARRDIGRLRELGLIVPGDEKLVAHLPAGQRPAVYDLPLSMKGPKPVKKSRNETGGKKPKVEPEETPGTDATPCMDARGGMDAGPTSGMEAGGTPCMDAGEKKPLNNPSEQPSSSAGRSPTVALVAGKLMIDDDEARQLIEKIRTDHQPRSIGAYIRSMPVEDLADKLSELREQRKVPGLPPWCGSCDEDARMEYREVYGQMRRVKCRRCHPESDVGSVMRGGQRPAAMSWAR